jgi:hypothetical protein
LAGELKGEESTLEGGEESGLESPESVSGAMVVACREAAGERATEGVERARECYQLNRIVQAAVEGGEARAFRVGCGRGVDGSARGGWGKVRSTVPEFGCPLRALAVINKQWAGASETLLLRHLQRRSNVEENISCDEASKGIK